MSDMFIIWRKYVYVYVYYYFPWWLVLSSFTRNVETTEIHLTTNFNRSNRWGRWLPKQKKIRQETKQWERNAKNWLVVHWKSFLLIRNLRRRKHSQAKISKFAYCVQTDFYPHREYWWTSELVTMPGQITFRLLLLVVHNWRSIKRIFATFDWTKPRFGSCDTRETQSNPISLALLWSDVRRKEEIREWRRRRCENLWNSNCLAK